MGLGGSISCSQDLAAQQPYLSDDVWSTLRYADSGVHWQHWTSALQEREDRDIGGVRSVHTPPWSSQVASLRHQIQEDVIEVVGATDADVKER